MTQDNKNLLNRFPPGFAAHKYRLTPEEMERNKRLNEIQRERQQRYRKKLIEEGKLPPDTELNNKQV